MMTTSSNNCLFNLPGVSSYCQEYFLETIMLWRPTKGEILTMVIGAESLLLLLATDEWQLFSYKNGGQELGISDERGKEKVESDHGGKRR